MKKLQAICFTAVGLAAVCCAAFSASAATAYIRGDADGDGKVNIRDVTKIQRVIAEIETDRDGWIKRRGNVTGGNFDITDATAIQRYLAEFDDPYQIGKTFTYDEYELPFIPNK